MYYFKRERATIVAIEKNNLPFCNTRQMHITVKVKKDDRIFSFHWSYAPTVIIDYKIYSNKVPGLFEEFWNDDNLEGKEVFLHHTEDDTYAYLSFIE